MKRIIGTDPDIALCSNNAAFVITLAAVRLLTPHHPKPPTKLTRRQEMFVQHMAGAAHDASKLEAKPRKNLQYKDVANAVSANDNLEFLEDVVPKTHPYKAVRQKAAETRARINGEAVTEEGQESEAAAPNGKKQQLLVNGGSGMMDVGAAAGAADREETGGGERTEGEAREEDANAQLELEANQAGGNEDVVMRD